MKAAGPAVLLYYSALLFLIGNILSRKSGCGMPPTCILMALHITITYASPLRLDVCDNRHADILPTPLVRCAAPALSRQPSITAEPLRVAAP